MSQRNPLPRLFALTLGLLILSSPVIAAEQWRTDLEREIKKIDERFSGELGVYVRPLGEEMAATHNADEDWYLASTTKVPLAIVLMQRAERGELNLQQELELNASDQVDGSGALLWAKPGTRYSLEELNKRSIEDSDSTATDMLIRFLGEVSFSKEVASLVPEGLGPVTTILQVRYDAYSEVHPDAMNLTNRDFIELKVAATHKARYEMLLDKLGISADGAHAGSISEAFDRYYQRGMNTGSLEAFGALLEKLVRGDLLTEVHTDRLLDYLSAITTGDRRIAAGLPPHTDFAHKTGTQVARSCDIGVLNPRTPEDAVIIAVCARNYGRLSEAEEAYRAIGKALTRNILQK